MDDERATLLLLEDDPVVRGFLTDNLTADGFDLRVCETVAEALRGLRYHAIDLALLDLGLPDGSGLDLLRRIRGADDLASRLDRGLPVILLTGRAGELDRLRGFACGADDYVAKPFSYGELRARIDAVLRRAGQRRGAGVLRIGELELDPAGRVATVGGERLELSAKEFALLAALAAEPTRVFAKEELLRDVWGFRARGNTRTLDTHACRLRRKFAERGAAAFVVNVWGVGYKLVDGVAA